MSNYDLEKAHSFSSDNKIALKKDKICGCFYCMKIFEPEKIRKWIPDNEQTAVCPYCGIDSIIGESSGFPVTKDFLKEMHLRWFGWSSFPIEHAFYSIIGKHAHESVEDIISRKNDEIQTAGFSLWSVQIDKKSIEQVWELPEDADVYVLCSVGRNAKDPAEKSDIRLAETMIGPESFGEQSVPEGIKTTYSSEKKNGYQAYVVGEYYDLSNKPETMDLGCFESTLSHGEKRNFKERFSNTRFQNVYGKLTPQIETECTKKISMVFRLKYPFVVEIK